MIIQVVGYKNMELKINYSYLMLLLNNFVSLASGD